MRADTSGTKRLGNNGLRDVLHHLHEHTYPQVSNPPDCKKRASVALVIRLRPDASYWPCRSGTDSTPSSSFEDRLNGFFDQAWVQHADPEVLFIKRAARTGDRWTSHVALPGGKREPADSSDWATGARETLEEVGLDLNAGFCLPVGNLPERIVTTSWGKVPLMVLCPFVCLVTHHHLPPLRLQPTEVGSTHWVSLRALLSPSLRTYERADVSDRLAGRSGPVTRGILRAILGQMLFAAVRLVPTESLYCSSVPGFIPDSFEEHPKRASVVGRLRCWWRGDHAGPVSTERPLLLWGLTLGIVADFLEMLPPHNALDLWTWPTFSPWDVRLVLWIMSYSFRMRRLRQIGVGQVHAPAAVEEGAEAIDAPKGKPPEVRPGEVGIGGLGAGQLYSKLKQSHERGRSSAVGIMLEGYYDLVRRAVFVALVLRVATGLAMSSLFIKRFRRH